MKNVYIIIRSILLCALLMVVTTMPAHAGHIRQVSFIPRKMEIRNDSVHLQVEMNLEGVTVNSLTAVLFTPILAGPANRQELPPVIVTGKKRFRFDRRQWVLAGENEKPFPTPHLILIPKKKENARQVQYCISLPYAAWMKRAALLMKQEVKDCCDLQLLGIDTVSPDLSLPTPSAHRDRIHKDNRTAAGARTATRRIQPDVVTPLQPPVTVPTTHQRIGTKYTIPQESVTTYASMLSFLEPDLHATGKQHEEVVALYLDYPLGKDNVLPNYKNNRIQLDKLFAVLAPLMKNGFSTIQRIEVCGYASPDGDYRNNERLAAGRSRQFAHYVQRTYSIPAFKIGSSCVAEDWEGFTKLLIDERPYYMNEALDIIHRYGVFDGRERILMNLWNGVPYKDMLHRFFPRLRRIEVTVRYGIRAVDGDEASRLIYTHPELLNLSEIYAVARYYRPGTEQYREVYEIAAYHFPDDVVANVNAASAVMLTGDLQSASDYLSRTMNDPRSWNNQGVLSLMEGETDEAIAWFRRAVGIEPRKARQNLQIAQAMREGVEYTTPMTR